MTPAEALLPLYQAYLRRLDQMAARIAPGSLLREAITRGDDGKIIEGDDGLPLRFDVADSSTGETFEVHGKTPDAPAAEEIALGSLRIALRAGNWEELPVVCVFQTPPPRADAEALARLFASFGEVAACGAFVAGIGNGRLHSIRAVELRENEMWAVYDFGSCPPLAVEALLRALAGFGEDRLPIQEVRIGGSFRPQ